MKSQSVIILIQTCCRTTIFSGLLCCFFTGCCTVETWTWCGRSKICIEDAECILSNGVVRAIKVKGTSMSPFKMNDMRETIIDVAQPHPCEKRTISFRHVQKSKVKSTDGHILSVSRQEWNDSNFMTHVLSGHEAQDFVILISDLTRWRKYFAIPIQHECSEDKGVSWTFLILEDPWIHYEGNYCIKEDVGWPVCLGRIVLVPFAVLCDAITSPVQIVLGAFCHM